MLQTYTQIDHKLDKWQRYVDHLVREVWKNAPDTTEFHSSLFSDDEDLEKFIQKCGFNSKATMPQKQFYQDVKSIYEKCVYLTTVELEAIVAWYESNRDVELLCNDATLLPNQTNTIPKKIRPLVAQIIAFFKSLWNEKLLGRKNLQDYYTKFIEENNPAKCHFCGLTDMTTLLGLREDFDHYLPKSKFPTNAVNFRNLVPTCHHCNSKFKVAKNPLLNASGTRSEVLYPYSAKQLSPKVEVNIEGFERGCRVKGVSVSLISDSEEELDTWRWLYGITSRYEEKCSSKDAKEWLEHARLMHETYSLTLADQNKVLEKNMKKLGALANCNFLKFALLKECENKGLFMKITKRETP